MPTTFIPAGEDVQTMALEVLNAHTKFTTILVNEVRIEYLLAFSDGDAPALRHHGAAALAMIKIVPPEERATGGPDLRVKIDARKFEKRNNQARRAILAHEFYHVSLVRKDGKLCLDPYGRPRIKLIPDDWTINGFLEVSQWYGDDSAERRSFEVLSAILGQGTFAFLEQRDDLSATKSEQGPPMLTPGEVMERPTVEPTPAVEREPALADSGAVLRGTIVGTEIDRMISKVADDHEPADEVPGVIPFVVGDVVRTSYNEVERWAIDSITVKPGGGWMVMAFLVCKAKRPARGFFHCTMEGRRVKLDDGGYLAIVEPAQDIDHEPVTAADEFPEVEDETYLPEGIAIGEQADEFMGIEDEPLFPDDSPVTDLDAVLAEACEKAEARKAEAERSREVREDLAVFPKMFTPEDIEACQKAEDEGLSTLPKPKQKPEPEDDGSAVFVIRSKNGALKGFVDAPGLKAAKAYQAETFPGAAVELDDNGMVTRSPGYSVPTVDAAGKLAEAIRATKAKRERPAVRLKPLAEAKAVRP